MQTYSPGRMHVIEFKDDQKLQQIEKDSKSNELVLPDTHGHTGGIIHKLRDAGVVEVDQFILNEINALCAKSTSSAEDLKKIDELLGQITFHSTQYQLIRFLGDMLSDRNGNDWFTLKLLKKLKEKGIHYEIILSNHDLEFLRWYNLINDEKKPAFSSNIPAASCRKSLTELDALYQSSVVTATEIQDIVNNYYLPHLRLPSVTFDEENFCSEQSSKPQAIRYTHAPSGIETTIPLYQTFVKKPTPNLETVIDVMDAHDEIEEAFQKELKSAFWKRNTITETMSSYGISASARIDPSIHPIEYICWNKAKSKITGSENYQMHIIHGHTGALSQKWETRNVKGCSLDVKNTFGKLPTFNQTAYTVYTSPSYLPSFKKLYNALQVRKNAQTTEVKSDDTYAAGMALYTSSKAFLKYCMKHNLRKEYEVVKKIVTQVTEAIESNSQDALNKLETSISEVSQLQCSTKLPSKAKRYLTGIAGALCIIAGAFVVSAGIFAIPFTFGMSISLAAGLGGGLIAFGIMLGYSQDQLRRSINLFNDFNELKNQVATTLSLLVSPKKNLRGG